MKTTLMNTDSQLFSFKGITNFLIKFLTVILIVFLLNLSHSTAQECNEAKKLPTDLELVYDESQTYSMSTEYRDYDIFGNFMSKKLISAEYTIGFDNDLVKWNKVEIAESKLEAAKYPKGNEQVFMKGFTYQQSMDKINEAFMTKLPQADVFMKNLTWDVKAVESFAWNNWNKLELNKEYAATPMNASVDLANQGTFENKDIRITWIGNTTKNNIDCAIIKFAVMGNPLQFKTSNIQVKGRSHYWGNIFVSLTNKQIEYAELYEDVVMNVKVGEAQSNLINTVRNIYVEKKSH